MKLHDAFLVPCLLGAWFTLQSAPMGQTSSRGATSTIDGVDTLEFFVGEPDSIIGYAFDYDGGGPGGTRRSRCFVNYPTGEAAPLLLTVEEIDELRDLIRTAREVSTEFDGQFSACCGIPAFGFEMYRGGRAGCLELYLCECRCGWTFSRRGYSDGGVCPEMLDEFRSFGDRLITGR